MPRISRGRIFWRAIDPVTGKAVDKPTREDKKEQGSWYIDYTHRGKRYRESVKSTRERDAQHLLNQRLGEIGTGTFKGPKAEKVTFEDLLALVTDDYRRKGRRSTRRLNLSIAHLTKIFHGMKAMEITPEDLLKYQDHRKEGGAADQTILHELAALKRGFRIAVKLGKLSSMPAFPKIDVKNVRTGFVNNGDIDAIVAELPEHLKPVARFGYLTGWRKGEILALHWSAVDRTAGVIRLEPGTTKNDEGREFPYAEIPVLKILIEEQLRITKAVEKETGTLIPWVFHHDGGKPIRSMDGAWRAACKRAGYEGTLFHDLRRSAVRNLERAGVSRSVAMSFTGHKTQNVYSRYAIVDPEVQREGARKLAIVLDGPREGATVTPITRKA